MVPYTKNQTTKLDTLTTEVQRVSTPIIPDTDAILSKALEAQKTDLTAQFQQLIENQAKSYAEKLNTAVSDMLEIIKERNKLATTSVSKALIEQALAGKVVQEEVVKIVEDYLKKHDQKEDDLLKII